MQQVRSGRFREDLFYRLNVYPIMIPPLRQRREDIEPLAQFLKERALKHHSPGRRLEFAPATLRLLEAYDWPGNVRQLENAILRAILLCDGDTLEPADFPQISHEVDGHLIPDSVRSAVRLHQGAAVMPVQPPLEVVTEAAPVSPLAPAKGMMRTLDDRGNVRSLAEVEVEMIRFAIEHYSGQMSEVARRLGIGRSTLYRKMKEYDIASDAEHLEQLAT